MESHVTPRDKGGEIGVKVPSKVGSNTDIVKSLQSQRYLEIHF